MSTKSKNITIAILASTASLASAMQIGLEKRYEGADFKHITKIGERPAGAFLASLGLPSFIPGSDGIKVLSFGSRMLDGATPAERSNQWTTLRDPSASVEDVLAELGNYSEYTVLQGKAISEAKEAILEVREAAMDATTPEEELEIFKKGFLALAKMLA